MVLGVHNHKGVFCFCLELLFSFSLLCFFLKPSPEADKLIDKLFSSSEEKRKLLEIPMEEIEKMLFGLTDER